MKYYMRNQDEKLFTDKAMVVVRLFFEEAWRRAVMGVDSAIMRSGLCSVVLSMKNLEADTNTIHEADLGLFWTFEVNKMRSLAEKICKEEGEFMV